MSDKDTSHIPTRVISTKKFKTVTLSVNFKSKLDETRLSARNLLSKMMIKRTENHPSEIALLEHLAKYYGAHLSSTTSKRGIDHVVQIRMEFVNEKFVLEDVSLFDEMIALLKDILHSPASYSEDTQSYFVQEYRLYKNRLTSLLDNRNQRAYTSLVNTMFKDHPMRLPAHGSLALLEGLTFDDVKEEHHRMMMDDEVSIVVVGDVDAAVESKFEGLFSRHGAVYLSNKSFTLDPPEKVTHTTDTMDIEQSKLILGFTVVAKDKTERINLNAMNRILGGSTNSYLFTNVRERMSLCYQIGSSMDAKNGFMYILAGVDHNNVDVAKEAILKEFERIRSGDITDEYIDEIKLMMRVDRQEIEDRPRGLISIAYTELITGKKSDYEALLKLVTKENIIEVANRVTLDTIHVLTGGAEDAN